MTDKCILTDGIKTFMMKEKQENTKKNKEKQRSQIHGNVIVVIAYKRAVQ